MSVALQIVIGSGEGRAASIGIVASAAMAFGASYALCIRQLPFLDTFDAEFLERTLRLRAIPGFSFMMRRARNRAPWAGVS